MTTKSVQVSVGKWGVIGAIVVAWIGGCYGDVPNLSASHVSGGTSNGGSTGHPGSTTGDVSISETGSNESETKGNGDSTILTGATTDNSSGGSGSTTEPVVPSMTGTSSSSESEDGTSSGEESTSSTEESTGSEATEGSGEDDSSSEDESNTGSECDDAPRPLTQGQFFQPLANRPEGILDLYEDDGVQFELVGRVLDDYCKPVANAEVGMWHASPRKRTVTNASMQEESASFDHPSSEPDSDPNEHKYYGKVSTDAEGNFRFVSLRPGWYLKRVANVEYYRPAHLYINVTVNSEDIFTTQLYFRDDPERNNDVENGQGHLYDSNNVIGFDAQGKSESVNLVIGF